MKANRIQELAEQAGLHAYYEAQASQIQKFAELIIAKCAKLCEPAAQPEPVMDYDKEELRGTVWDINKQFLAQPEQCVCGEPLRLNIVHRKDSPCFDYIEREWVGLTGDDMDDITSTAIDKTDSMLLTEAKLKELNA